jgi:hypothetical protein
MITLNGHNPDLLGLSTDTKPLTGYGVNTLFLELDTADFYYFTGGDWAKVGADAADTRSLSLNLNRGEVKSLAAPEEIEEITEEEPQEEIAEVIEKNGKTK